MYDVDYELAVHGTCGEGWLIGRRRKRKKKEKGRRGGRRVTCSQILLARLTQAQGTPHLFNSLSLSFIIHSLHGIRPHSYTSTIPCASLRRQSAEYADHADNHAEHIDHHNSSLMVHNTEYEPFKHIYTKTTSHAARSTQHAARRTQRN